MPEPKKITLTEAQYELLMEHNGTLQRALTDFETAKKTYEASARVLNSVLRFIATDAKFTDDFDGWSTKKDLVNKTFELELKTTGLARVE